MKKLGWKKEPCIKCGVKVVVGMIRCGSCGTKTPIGESHYTRFDYAEHSCERVAKLALTSDKKPFQFQYSKKKVGNDNESIGQKSLSAQETCSEGAKSNSPSATERISLDCTPDRKEKTA